MSGYGPLCAICGALPVSGASWECDDCAQLTEEERELAAKARRAEEQRRHDARRAHAWPGSAIAAEARMHAANMRAWAAEVEGRDLPAAQRERYPHADGARDENSDGRRLALVREEILR